MIVPARNEAGNIEEIFDRVPEMGAGTELMFVEGHSRDDTCAAIERAHRARIPERRCQLFHRPARARATRCGSGFARGDAATS